MKQKKITKKELKKLEKREMNKKDKEWREIVKKRDNSKCVICGRTDIIHCHHIIPREDKRFRWNINNGLCLCPKNHKYSYEISPHKNAFAFFIWMIENRLEQFNKLIKLWEGD